MVNLYDAYIVAVSFFGGGNRSNRRKPPNCPHSQTDFITLLYPRSPKGEGGILFYLCPSFRPSYPPPPLGSGGIKTLPTIWGTYMKLVTKYQIFAINSCWEKCDEKCAYMFNVYKNQQGEGGILFYLCPSFRPSKIFFVAFFSITVDGRNLIFSITLTLIIIYHCILLLP
jgi:hypothetical protein